MKRAINRFLVAGLVCLALLSFGCSFDNTLYNAKKYFKSAQARPLNESGKPTPQAVEDYTKTIKKCGYILTERKNSKQADDALFLLAKSLYFKGNSQYQAKDQFTSLVRNFPDSHYATEATLYIARINREINEPEQAVNILNSYILNPRTAKWHPQALLMLADFSIQDKDFPQTQTWLDKILTVYPQSAYAKEALFLSGKSFYEQKAYQSSLQQFYRVLSLRRVPRSMKFDSRFYIALNLLYLQDPQKSLTMAQLLLKKENRPEKLPLIKLLISRILLNMNDDIKATEILNSVTKAYPNSLLSAEAYYWLAEHNYYVNADVTSAIEQYGKAKTESNTSPFLNDAEAKFNALTLVKQDSGFDITEDVRMFVDRKLEIAENYYLVFDQPDSAQVMYNDILNLPSSLQVTIDSLQTAEINLQQKVDSLKFVNDSMTSMPDSLPNVSSEAKLDYNSAKQHEGIVVQSYGHPDSLSNPEKEHSEMKPDSLLSKASLPALTTIDSTGTSVDRYQASITDIELKIAKFHEAKAKVELDLKPYAMFVRASLMQKNYPDTTQLRINYNELDQQYPQNKYTHALKLILEGKPVRLVNWELERQETELDKALGDFTTAPDSALVTLLRLSASEYPEIKSKANFRLGWHYLFEQPDTSRAGPYFSEVIRIDRLSDYGKMTLNFYNGSKFIQRSAQEDSIILKTVTVDSLLTDVLKDSLNNVLTPDSLKSAEKSEPLHDENPVTIKPVDLIDNLSLPADSLKPIPPVIKPE
jgi:TolA-binding protein